MHNLEGSVNLITGVIAISLQGKRLQQEKLPAENETAYPKGGKSIS